MSKDLFIWIFCSSGTKAPAHQKQTEAEVYEVYSIILAGWTLHPHSYKVQPTVSKEREAHDHSISLLIVYTLTISLVSGNLTHSLWNMLWVNFEGGGGDCYYRSFNGALMMVQITKCIDLAWNSHIRKLSFIGKILSFHYNHARMI